MIIRLNDGNLLCMCMYVFVESICKRVQVNENGSSNNSLDHTNVSLVYDTFFMAMKDYTLDSRGDVGAG